MDKLDRLERELEGLGGQFQGLKGEVRQLKSLQRPMEIDYSAIRLQILEGKDYDDVGLYASESDQPARKKHNEKAYGGNIVADIFVLEQLGEDRNPKLSQCCQNFSKIYGISFGTARDIIDKASHSVIGLYDFRGHVRLLKRWKSQTREVKDLVEEIETKCRSAISRWEKWAEDPSEENEPSLEEKRIEVHRLYARS